MKTIAAFLIAMVSLANSLHANEFVESNITIALKFYINSTDIVEKGDSESLNYSTVTLKNFDIIDAYAYAYGGYDFDKTARLIRRDEFDENGDLVDTRIFIRDKFEGDVDVTEEFIFEFFATIVKYKYSLSKGTGTSNLVQTSQLSFLESEPLADVEDEEITVVGIDKVSIRTVAVRDQLVDLETRSSLVNGEAFLFAFKFEDFFEGIVEGTYKTSGAKVVVILD